jgi:tRNA(Ile)-lysidine synthase TilS/MesJ
MRRGALHTAAKELGCNKVALGHHFDDVVETFMLNLFYEGRLGCFQPVTYLSRIDLHVIRPLIYMPEKDVRYFANKVSLPVISSPCPADKNTERENMKQLLASIEKENKGLRYRIFGAIQRGEIDGFKTMGRMQGGMNNYCNDNEENKNE